MRTVSQSSGAACVVKPYISAAMVDFGKVRNVRNSTEIALPSIIYRPYGAIYTSSHFMCPSTIKPPLAEIRSEDVTYADIHAVAEVDLHNTISTTNNNNHHTYRHTQITLPPTNDHSETTHNLSHYNFEFIYFFCIHISYPSQPYIDSFKVPMNFCIASEHY